MLYPRTLILIGALASCLCAQTLVSNHGTFTLIDYPDAASTQIWGINARGEMVGVYVDAARATHGFHYSRGRFTSIDYPGAALTLANNINAQGDIAGEYALTTTGPHRGFLLSGGRFTTVDHPSASSNGVVGVAANGDMAGFFDNPLRGYFLSGNKFTPIDMPNASPTVIGAISPQGDVVGSGRVNGVSRAFLYRNGEFVNTWDYPGANGFTNAIGINAAGDIVGRYLDSANVSHGYLFSKGQFTSFDCPGATFTGAAGITPDGDIAGRCTIGGVSHGFLLKRGRQPRYTVTDLGTLGGNLSFAYGVSNSGVVAGSAALPNGDQHPFLWQNGKMVDLGTAGGANGSGQNPSGSLRVPIVTETSRTDPQGGDFCGWGTHRICLAGYWKDGKLTTLPTLGGNNAIGFSGNERGQIVGYAEKSTPDATCAQPGKLAFAPAMWSPNGEISELSLPKGDSAGWAYGVNDKGEAVGATGTCENVSAPAANGFLAGPRAVLWENGIPRDLGKLGPDGDTVAVGINNRTEIVGSSAYRGFLWSRDQGMEEIAALGEDQVGAPSSINNSRQVTGASCDAQFNCAAMLWERYTSVDLNTLVPEDTSMYLVFGTWINDIGEIAGWGIDKKTEEPRAFLARPTQPAVGIKTNAVRPALPFSMRSRLQQRLSPNTTRSK